MSFPFFHNLFPFSSLREPCCSPTAPVGCAMEAKRLSAERGTFAAEPRGDYKTGGFIPGCFSLLMLLWSPALWQPEELCSSERGGRRKDSGVAVWEQPWLGWRRRPASSLRRGCLSGTAAVSHGCHAPPKPPPAASP